LDRVRSVAYDG